MSLEAGDGNIGILRLSSRAMDWAAQTPVTKASARPPAYPRLLNPPASTPATNRPGIGVLSFVSAQPWLSMEIPPYEKVILWTLVIGRVPVNPGTYDGCTSMAKNGPSLSTNGLGGSPARPTGASNMIDSSLSRTAPR